MEMRWIGLIAVFILIMGYAVSESPMFEGGISLPSKVIGAEKEPVVRTPQVAGSFYTTDPEELQQQISSFLKKAKKEDVEDLSVLIVPHAGYVYSGQVAAYSYKQLAGKEYDTVVVIGPSHYQSFDGISVFNGDYYETPLGRVEVDRKLADFLIDSSEKINYLPKAEQNEHSVEVQVPFLQSVLQDFKIVPILMGDQTLENAEILANVLSKYADEKTLIVASSDLSHYHDYDTAVAMDNLTLGYVENLDVDGLYKAISGAQSEMCGHGHVMTAMLVAKKMGKTEVRILNYANSGDVTGDRSQVVGYGAAVMYGHATYTGQERAELLRIARKSIESYVKHQNVPTFKVTNPNLMEKGAAFVTITEGGNLRGCIGTTQAMQPLYLTVRDVAISAAVEDPRFAPLDISDLDKIHLEVSVLSEPREIGSIEEIEVGRHGLIVEKGAHSGLLLPQVAAGYGWDKTTFLGETCKKAGLDKNCWTQGARILTFETEAFGE